MKKYVVDVVYQSTITEATVVTATDKEDAKEKIRQGVYDDVIDTFSDNNGIVDFIFHSEEELE